mgnify:CR=1 FL=1
MLVSYKWLKELVDIDVPSQELAEKMSTTGIEVEGVESPAAGLSKIVVGEVLSCEDVPETHLHVCQVNVGEEEARQIVCGAPNVRAGIKVMVALSGARIADNYKIKKGKIRGLESLGMICSLGELGISDSVVPKEFADGIQILPDDAVPGEEVFSYLDLDDEIIELSITPNRADALSMRGVAHEVAAIYDKAVSFKEFTLTETNESATDALSVGIETDKAPYYAARILDNVTIAPSPQWLQNLLMNEGIRPINNVVDVTNYILLYFGQPMHAFDLDTFEGNDIRVREARAGEKLVTLDGEERELAETDLVITVADKPVALAGVMGGLDSEITENTVDVLLESAVFDNGHISRTSRNLDLMSEASIRYERLVDPNGCASVADIAATLFEECCGAEVCPGIVDVYPKVKEAVTIALRPERVCALAGAQIPEGFMVSRLARLGCKVTPADDGNLSVVAPTNRPDLTREVDLIEEIVRLWGEGDIEATLPAARNHAGGLTLEQRQIRKIGRTLRSLGLNETKSYLFASPDDLSKLGMSEEGRGVPVKVISPLVADQSEMRRSIVPGLLRSIAYNLAHGVSNIAMYELGRVLFGHKDKSQPDEPRYVCGVLVGRPADDTWDAKYLAYDFFDAKGIVEGLLEALRIPKVRFRVAEPEQYGWLQPGRAAEILAGSETIGWVGNIHPLSLQNFDIEVPVIAFEISVASLLRLSQKDLPIVEPPTYPGISIDLAIVVDESVTAEQLVQRLKSAGGKLLCDIRLFDVYRDALRVGKGKKSMAFSLTYRADDRTLTSEEVEKTHTKLVEKVLRSTGGEIRG